MSRIRKVLQRLLAAQPRPAAGSARPLRKPASAAAVEAAVKLSASLETRAAPRDEILPATFVTASGGDAAAARIFDPALCHLGRAFRAGDIASNDSNLQTRWVAARRTAMHHLLGLLGSSPWRATLVLRGSLLLKHWMGDAAREPHDMDWIVHPKTFASTDRNLQELFNDIVRAVAENPVAGEVNLHADQAAMDDIWTYDRAPGRRIVIPWTADALPPGAVQMDFVFGEELLSEPVVVKIAAPNGAIATILGVSAEQSLAWKLLWLDSDHHPQGKDLYDATLLAESVTLPIDLLAQTFLAAKHRSNPSEIASSVLQWHVDWDNFVKEYPAVGPDGKAWRSRLAGALHSSLKH